MNLIEQLGEKESLAAFVVNGFGGYEKAKAVLNSPNSAFLHNTKALKERLLEYRRENNIFENGDKIIFSVMGNSVMNFDDCLRMFLSQGLIRHATDLEIAQGYRDE